MLAAAALAISTAASFESGARRVELNLGPGDGPFVRGFQRDNDVENKVGWHWTSYNASIDLPLLAVNTEVQATLRYARVFGEEAVAEVRIGGVEAGSFRARGGEVRSTTLRAAGVEGPLVVGITVDSHERRNMGLRIDRIVLDASSGGPFRLRPEAAIRPVVAMAALFAGLVVLSGSPLVAGGVALVAAVAFAAGARVDLFGSWGQTRWLPEMIVLGTIVLLPLRRFMERRGLMDGVAARALAGASLTAMVLRLVLLTHPDFYYPDLLTHARVVETIRAEGLAFFLHPADALNAQGAWTKPVLGGVASLPYAVAFHALFVAPSAIFDWPRDDIESALKAGSSLISVLPILLAGGIATRLSLPPAAALMLAIIPTYASRLSFALLPALTGHAFDLLAILTIMSTFRSEESPHFRSSLAVALALTCGHLAYTSSVVNEGVFVASLALLWMVGRSAQPAFYLVVAEAFAALMAFGLYYRHFVADAFSLLGRLLGTGGGPVGSTAPSVYPIESFWALLFERTNTFFGWSYMAVALIGLFFYPEARRSKVVHAWGLAYLTLILLRAKIPDVFRYGHETLFLTPLVALFAGAAIVAGWQAAGVRRLAALLGGGALAAWSFWTQWLAFKDQLANAL